MSTTAADLEVADGQATPLLLKVLDHEAPMAVLRLGLAAQEHTRDGEQVPRHGVLHLPVRHQREELPFVVAPRALVLLQAIEHLLSRSQKGLVDVLRLAELTEEVGEVLLLREAGKLGSVVQADVEETLYACFAEGPEEALCRPLGETDRTDFHSRSLSASLGPKRVG